MDKNIKRVHYFHADANALGGKLERPVSPLIPVQAPLSLPPVGGYASARTETFRLEGILSFRAAHTQVAGSAEGENGPWTTLVTSVVEGLNVLDILTADRLVAQISTEHPKVGHVPKVKFLGTQFENLRVAGHPLEIEVDLGFADTNDGADYPSQPCIRDPQFLTRVGEQRRRIVDERSIPEWCKDKTVPSWVRDRYPWDSVDAKGGKDGVLCSVVKAIRGQFPGRVFGNALEIPDFGRVHLGELLVDANSYRLIMARLELGCPTQGDASVSSANIEGRTHP
jgi:hypothetical protein